MTVDAIFMVRITERRASDKRFDQVRGQVVQVFPDGALTSFGAKAAHEFAWWRVLGCPADIVFERYANADHNEWDSPLCYAGATYPRRFLVPLPTARNLRDAETILDESTVDDVSDTDMGRLPHPLLRRLRRRKKRRRLRRFVRGMRRGPSMKTDPSRVPEILWADFLAQCVDREQGRSATEDDIRNHQDPRELL